MKISMEINECSDCRHQDHSGAFTSGGAKLICGHSDACDTATAKKHINKKDPDDKYHWRHRVLRAGRIPEWCPMKHGYKY